MPHEDKNFGGSLCLDFRTEMMTPRANQEYDCKHYLIFICREKANLSLT